MSDVTEKKRPQAQEMYSGGGLRKEVYIKQQADAIFESLESERDVAFVACARSCDLHGCASKNCTPERFIADGKAIVAERDALKARVEELEKLAYLGDHHFPDLTYKARMDELVPQFLQQRSDLAREKERSAAALTRIEELTNLARMLREELNATQAQRDELERRIANALL